MPVGVPSVTLAALLAPAAIRVEKFALGLTEGKTKGLVPVVNAPMVS